MSTMPSQITSLKIVDSSVYSGMDQRKHQSSASLAFVQGIHRLPVNSLHKGPVTQKMFPLDNIIMDAFPTLDEITNPNAMKVQSLLELCITNQISQAICIVL